MFEKSQKIQNALKICLEEYLKFLKAYPEREGLESKIAITTFWTFTKFIRKLKKDTKWDYGSMEP